MQFTVATLATLFAVALSAPSDISARQATLATLVTYSDSGCQNAIGTSVPLTNQAACKDLPAGIVGGKIAQNLPAGCTIEFHKGPGCGSQERYTYPTDNLKDPHACFQLGGPTKPLGSYLVKGNCA